MKVCIDSDATGDTYRRKLTNYLKGMFVDATDLDSPHSAQYPDIAHGLAYRISSGEFERGILICGTGLGMAMTANKVKGIFAGTPQNAGAAQHMARSNHAQVLTIGCHYMDLETAKVMISAWLNTQFEPRHNADRMRALES